VESTGLLGRPGPVVARRKLGQTDRFAADQEQLLSVQVDDREQLAAVWLVEGPGRDAALPLRVGGRFAEERGEWYFPKGTRVDEILSAAGVEQGLQPQGPVADEEGMFDPLVERIEDQDVAVDEDSPRLQAVTRAVKAWTDQLIDRSARNNLLFFRDQRAGTLDLTQAPARPVFDISPDGRAT
jgi:hypothetical protein